MEFELQLFFFLNLNIFYYYLYYLIKVVKIELFASTGKTHIGCLEKYHVIFPCTVKNNLKALECFCIYREIIEYNIYILGDDYGVKLSRLL